MVMEYCNRGSLWDAIQRGDAGSALNYKKIIEVALEVTIGLQYLHRIGIIHGDIKAVNVPLQS